MDQPHILPRVAEGDAGAVEECLQKYGNLVWSLANQKLRNSADAEDAVQDIFIELWMKAKSFDPEKASETTFIAMIARRRLIDRMRKHAASPDEISMSAQPVEVEEPELVDSAELHDEAEKVSHCMRKLSGDQRRVIGLSVGSGLSHSGIAKQLALPLGTVKSYARRALIQLRDCMRRSRQARAFGV